MPAKRLLFFPTIEKGMGTGHLRRCVETAASLGARAALLLEDGRRLEDWAADVPRESPPDENAVPPPPRQGFHHTLVVLDQRQTTRDALRFWAERACPILWDDDGPARRNAPFLVDVIPGPRASEANVQAPSLMNLPRRRRHPDPMGSVLVSFGGEDALNLSLQVIQTLLTRCGIPPERISATLPPTAKVTELPRGVGILKSPTGLRDRLGDYGLVLTSYGLTAWEAVAAGCAVLLVAPSAYHASLARQTGFPVITWRRQERGLPKLMARPNRLIRAAEALSEYLEKRLAEKVSSDLFAELEAPAPCCLACGLPLPRVIARFPRRTYYRCSGCGMTGMYRFLLKDEEYNSDYFHRDYARQYGRTYLEDFASIKARSLPRLGIIGHKSQPGGRLLDIGCAFGPFLQAASEAGYSVHGMDMSREGVQYIQTELGLPAEVGSFPLDDPVRKFGGRQFDVLTLWYVIEHFSDLAAVMDRVVSILRPGGVLALATPNGSGVSARRNRRSFLHRSPQDHYSVWTPSAARRLLAGYGFSVYRIRVTGHHPERFGLRLRRGGAGEKLLNCLSRAFGLGDTFEVYAVKEKNHG